MTFTPGSIAPGAANVQLDFVSGSAGYRAILADPPWQFSVRSPKGKGRSPDGFDPKPFGKRENTAERHYKTMTLPDIMAMPVGSLAATDCVLFMWAVDPMLPQAIAVGEAWGFQFKTIAFVWAKQRRTTSKRGAAFDDPWHKQFPMGTGYWTRANPELCLLFTRGQPRRLATDVRKLLIAPRREHSRKPDEAHDRIMRLVDGPYLELFARERRPGWDAWGNQIEKFNEAETTACLAPPSRQLMAPEGSSALVADVAPNASAAPSRRRPATGRSPESEAALAMPLFASAAASARPKAKTSAKAMRPTGTRAANPARRSTRQRSSQTCSE